MRNAFEHAQAKRIEVEIRYDEPQFRLRAPEQIGKSGGLGVINMRERVLQLNGTFELVSAPGRGTTVKVTVPFRPA